MIFRIENVGPIREAEVDLGKRFIVLTGPNNTGKTYFAWSVYALHKRKARTGSPLFQILRGQLNAPATPAWSVSEFLSRHLDLMNSVFALSFLDNLAACFASERNRFETARATIKEAHDLGTAARSEASSIASSTPSLFYHLHRLCFDNCVIFPAERIAVNLFAREVALHRTQLVDDLVDAELEADHELPLNVIARAGRYPWPIRDCLRIANDLTNLSKQESAHRDIADEIESAVLGGAVEVTGDGEMSFVPGDAPEQHLGVHLTASVVKSLSSLVFYFRHLAQPNDFLIIDEPELNLHPDNQRKLTRILAKATRRGFRILISTHSDYVVRELNHMIMLSQLPSEEARSFGYDPECALAPADLGVYLFDKHTATAVPVTETGFSIDTIDAEINTLNADAQRLYSRLFDRDSD